MRIDVVMPTYNSNKPLFPIVLRSIKRYVPLNKLIVVDKYSSDGTLELVKQIFPNNSVIIKADVNVGYARYLGIKYVETEWFAFIDDDVIIFPHWYSTLVRFIRLANVGAVEGSFVQLTELREGEQLLSILYKYSKYLHIISRLSIHEITIKDIILHGLSPTRAIFNNALIKSELVKDWRPNVNLGAYEDFSITQHVVNKGFKWLTINIPLCFHGNPPRDHISRLKSSVRKGLWEGAGIKYVGLSRNVIALYSISRLFGSIIRLFKYKDFADLAMRIAFILSLSSNKYLSPKR